MMYASLTNAPGAKEKTCSDVVEYAPGKYKCRNGHHMSPGCFGNGYPTGVPVPFCVREDVPFDEKRLICLDPRHPDARKHY